MRGDGQNQLKISAPHPIRGTYHLIPVLAALISLDSPFKIFLNLPRAYRIPHSTKCASWSSCPVHHLALLWCLLWPCSQAGPFGAESLWATFWLLQIPTIAPSHYSLIKQQLFSGLKFWDLHLLEQCDIVAMTHAISLAHLFAVFLHLCCGNIRLHPSLGKT